MANKNKKAILSYLENLMMHIIKWKSQEEKRSSSWGKTIRDSRKNISREQKKIKSLNDDFLKKNWDKTFEKAKKEAEGEMKQKSKVKSLTWKDVFLSKYTLLIALGFILFKLLT